jgi:hypothetical protein
MGRPPSKRGRPPGKRTSPNRIPFPRESPTERRFEFAAVALDAATRRTRACAIKLLSALEF